MRSAPGTSTVFIIMFLVLRGLTYVPRGSARPISDAVWTVFGRADQVADPGFIPRFLPVDSALYESLFAKREMLSFGLDLSKSAAAEFANAGVSAWPYFLLVIVLGALYLIQQRMVAARVTISPTMSPGQ